MEKWDCGMLLLLLFLKTKYPYAQTKLHTQQGSR